MPSKKRDSPKPAPPSYCHYCKPHNPNPGARPRLPAEWIAKIKQTMKNRSPRKTRKNRK